jgi:alcohol dehydrogenase class IV
MALINYITTVRLDFGAVRHLAEDCAIAGITRPMVVTDKGVVAAGLLERAIAFLPKGFVQAVYDNTPGNPTEEAVEEAVQMYRAHDCDGMIAIGGGSPMDLAKGVAIAATHDEPLIDFAAILGGTPKITSKMTRSAYIFLLPGFFSSGGMALPSSFTSPPHVPQTAIPFARALPH